MSDYWSKRLNDAFNADPNTLKRRGVRLPNHPDLVFSGTGDVVNLHLSASAVSSNMQTNAAAFESWALALRHWCAVTVSISWDAPKGHADAKVAAKAERHYQRFLYRLANFAELFSDDWLTVKDPNDALSRRKTLEGGSLFVNQGGDREKVQPEGDLPHEQWSEDRWECHLTRPDVRWLDDAFGGFEKKAQQFPVGLFDRPVPSEASRVFPGAKSAIDMIALTPSTILIFELKKSGNIGFGALSELLFYTWVVRDLATGRFQPTEARAETRLGLRIDSTSQNKDIRAVLLAPDVHPLVEVGVLRLINSALTKQPGPRIKVETARFNANLWSQAGTS